MKCTTMQNLLVFAIYGEINSELVLLSFGACKEGRLGWESPIRRLEMTSFEGFGFKAWI